MRSFFAKTFSVLIVVNVIATAALPSDALSARDTLVRFCELESEGNRFTEEGVSKAALFYAVPNTFRPTKILVVDNDYVVSNPSQKGNVAQFYVEYIALGEIDLQRMRFANLPRIKTRVAFDLVLTTKHGELGGDGNVEYVVGAPEWRIHTAPLEAYLTPQSSCGVVARLSDQSQDARLKKNASRILTQLGCHGSIH